MQKTTNLASLLWEVDHMGYQQVFNRFYTTIDMIYMDSGIVADAILDTSDDDFYSAIGGIYHLITGKKPEGWDFLSEQEIVACMKAETGVDIGKTRYLSGNEYPLYKLGRFSLFQIIMSLENTHGQTYKQIAEWFGEHPR
jgi:hypothetical protein